MLTAGTKEGDRLTASIHEVSRGRTLGTYRADVRREDGRRADDEPQRDPDRSAHMDLLEAHYTDLGAWDVPDRVGTFRLTSRFERGYREATSNVPAVRT